jgi:nuclear receptor subfamily 1 group D protein 3
VEFAKRIPGFTDLVQDDQLILIKAGFFEVWLVRISRMFNPQHFSVTFADGSVVIRDQLDLIYSSELVTAMFNFSMSFNNLHLNDGEIGLFTAVVILTQDRPGLSDPKTVEELQEKLIEALKLQLSRSHSSDPQVFPNLLMKLTELRTVGTKHNEVLGWYRMNWRRVKLPPLYAEIYDIPKSEEAFLGMQNGGSSVDGVVEAVAEFAVLPPPVYASGPPDYNGANSVH